MNAGWNGSLIDQALNGDQNMVNLAQSYYPMNSVQPSSYGVNTVRQLSALTNAPGTDTVLKAGGAVKDFTPTTLQKWTGYYDPKTGMTVSGIGQLALGGVNAVLGGYLGMKQYGLAKKQLAFQQDAFNKNYEAQRSSYNRDIESRARDMASRERLGDDFVNDYVKKHSV